MALGELLEIEQLPPSHDQVAKAQAGGSPAAGARNNFEQQPRHAVLVRDQDVGHEGTHDGAGYLPAEIDGDDPADFTPASGGGSVPHPVLGKAYEMLW